MDPSEVELSPEEEEKCRKVFAVFDRDGTGIIGPRVVAMVPVGTPVPREMFII